MNRPDQNEWRELKSLGLNFRIKTPESYVQHVKEGMRAALSVADGFTSGPWLDTAQITTLHWATFRNIFPWAGQLRVGELHGPTERFSDPNQIRTDLRTLNDVSRKEWFRTDDPNVQAREMAAYNAAFHNIQPFTKGSEEIGRLILSHQSRELFGTHINFENDLKVYDASLSLALKGKLQPLATQILEHSPVSREAEILRIDRTIESAHRELRARENDMSQSH